MPESNEKVDIYVKIVVPRWLEAAGYKPEAEVVRQLPPYDDENFKIFEKTLNRVRTTLRRKRHNAKRVAKHASWNAWPIYDVAWTVARGVAWVPTIELVRGLSDELTKSQRTALFIAGHTARAAAWALAWDEAVDRADENLDGKDIWNILHPIRLQIEKVLDA